VLEDVGQWVYGMIEAHVAEGLAPLLVIENLFPPIPSEVVLPLAGFFVGTGDLAFWGALLAATNGSTAGALILYGIGRWGGRRLVLRYGRWLRVREEDLDRADGWFARHGDLVVLVARVVPFARSVVSIPAGIARMPPVRFMVLTAAGSGVWNAVLIGAGYALGANWNHVSSWVGAYSDVVLVAVVAAAIVYLRIRHLHRRRRED
jgi:membrane protein DedA with SNARE-associated domain